jgi:uncharacterized protein
VAQPDMTAADWIARLKLQPHPEGGWYREIYRSQDLVAATRGRRAAITTIYYLLEHGQVSRWHVVASDEIWHFYAGDSLELLRYSPESRSLDTIALGRNAANESLVSVVPAHAWQAARPLGSYALVGCTVGPGFDFADFTFVADVPKHREHFVGALAPLASLL